ncbi:hypothetical protein KKF91_07650 [Myxococcota bacterium]|nr:hypothetical protein [Myxococcota bacterium]MBU1430417.1 hypothetical protein [Myxococcota bacterium]MBU1896867.1 hypothetical protein [Myxococcota bacterium]
MRKVTLALALAASLGCGVEDQAPAPDSRPLYLCPEPQEAAPEALALLSARQLPHLADFLRDGISSAEARVAVDGTLRLLRALSPAEMGAFVELINAPRVDEGLKILKRALRFILEGSAEAPGYQRALLEESLRVLTICDGAALFEASLDLFDAPEIPRLKANLTGLSGAFELDLSGLSKEALFSEHVHLLLRNLIFGLSHPNFDFEQHLRAPLEGFPLVDLTAPPFSEILDDVQALLAPERGLLAPLTDLACCTTYNLPTCAAVRAQPDAAPIEGEATFSRFAYEVFIWPLIDGQDDLTPLMEMLEDPAIADLAEPLEIVLRQYAQDAQLREGAAGIIKKIVDPDTTAGLIEDTLKLLDDAVIGQILDLLWTMADGCGEAPR